MLFEVDFALKINGTFQTISKDFIFAESVSECQDKAEEIRKKLRHSKNQNIYIFIEA